MIYLDSAKLSDAKRAAKLGFVSGITTNAHLLAEEGADPLEQLALLLLEFGNGPVFYQPRCDDVDHSRADAGSALDLGGDRVVIKLPATLEYVQLATELTGSGSRCALTAVFSPAQALLGHAAGCEWVIPYVNRAVLSAVGSDTVVRDIARLLASVDSSTQVLAASLKSVGQVVDSVVDGASAVTMPMNVIEALVDHGLTVDAVTRFAADDSKMRSNVSR
jgi:transaldolase